jgi:GT2 family glycosyltransferase
VKGGLNHLLPIPYWGSFIRWLGYRFKTKIPGVLKANVVEKVDWINGAFLMVKKTAVDKAGMLDEDFFLYSEEIEWCSRLQKAGSLCIFGNLKMIHLQGESNNSKQPSNKKGYQHLFDRQGLQLMVSHHVRIRKQYGTGWFLFLLINYTWGIFIFFIGATVNSLVTLRNPFIDWKNVALYAGNVFKLWSLTPTIIKNNPHFYRCFKVE